MNNISNIYTQVNTFVLNLFRLLEQMCLLVEQIEAMTGGYWS